MQLHKVIGKFVLCCRLISILLWIYVEVSVSHAGTKQIVTESEIALINGKIFQRNGAFLQALLIKGNKIIATGSNEDISPRLSPTTQVIDLKGATVIPGLIDSHIHAVRAGLTFGSEVNWIGVKTLNEALSLIKSKASTTPKHQWITVAGGWSETQFEEARRPSRQELDAVAMGHPVYIQHFYDAILLSSSGVDELLHSGKNKPLKAGELISRLRSDENQPPESGWLAGNSRTISGLYDLLPQPTRKQKEVGTIEFFRELNSLGVTGVLDPGGYNLPLSAYEFVKKLNRNNKLTLKIRYSVCAPRDSFELGDFKAFVKTFNKSEESPKLRFNGLGENVTWGMYNNEHPSLQQKESLKETLIWAAQQGLTVTLHWNNNDSAPHLLDVLEQVNQAQPITNLRWSVAHLTDASSDNLSRMQAIGVGWLTQNNFYYQGENFIKKRGLEASQAIPRINTALNLGINVGAGTDAHRVMSYNPFVALEWFLDGYTAGKLQMGTQSERPSREQAIQMYTTNSAWFSFEENTRGRLEPGYFADLVVLDKDYFTIPTGQISTIKPLLTFVDGELVYKHF